MHIYIFFFSKETEGNGPSNPKAKEIEVRELAPYFPRFIWLLRDFGLKLVDPNNNPITTKEYLEMALSQRTQEESKNEIRRGWAISLERSVIFFQK